MTTTTPAAAPPDAFTAQVNDRLLLLADDLPEPVRGLVRTLVAGPGKLVRPRLLAACASFGTADPDRLVRLGAVVELIHLASLLHDDVIDEAQTRRGAPAAHTAVGTEQAMLAGLACFALVGTEAADLGEGVAGAVSTTVAKLAYGELLDVERAFDTAFPLPAYLELVQSKTAELFRLCCLLGAAEGRCGPGEAGALVRFGAALGVTFQILDDCLDLSPNGAGKPVGTDHALGLFGAPTLYALRADSGGELATLLLSPSFSTHDLPEVYSLIQDRGGLDAAARLAADWHEQALAALEELPAGGPRDRLVTLAAALLPARR
ncbi:polyprenyl synthetase family protein [Nonomuraea cavernae]|uniref:Geranylgeranyl pyrophosphate synthase n=1 Tax=Nonomuraea cavernae TaxID=2045107 RepID=A0A917Z0M3_9ACTN|nr:polyprenyl synthetase family protein [Nonomuraea cavernae]MCA2187746.1 polyprenyl synthetase family protein [Nonomuraea cavernae]GGO71726.1 geranylgeranyl pyrophosphate synthase [Nonomuraea cavernae]